MDGPTTTAPCARPRRPLALLGTGALFLATISLAGLADRTPLSIVQFTPDTRAGADARNVTQAQVRFDRPMVQFGDPQTKDPAKKEMWGSGGSGKPISKCGACMWKAPSPMCSGWHAFGSTFGGTMRVTFLSVSPLRYALADDRLKSR